MCHLPEGFQPVYDDEISPLGMTRLLLSVFGTYYSRGGIQASLSEWGLRTREVGVVDSRARLVGYGVLGFDDEQGQLWSLAVEPNSRGAGIGTSLVFERLGIARELELDRVYTKIEAAKPLSCYADAGFVPNGDGWSVLYLP